MHWQTSQTQKKHKTNPKENPKKFMPMAYLAVLAGGRSAYRQEFGERAPLHSENSLQSKEQQNYLRGMGCRTLNGQDTWSRGG